VKNPFKRSEKYELRSSIYKPQVLLESMQLNSKSVIV
jgi:hypothetical protein